MLRAALFALVLAAALPVRAGMFDDEEARARIVKLRTDFEELAKRTDLAAKNQIDFANQVETIKADIAKLRGQIEVILYEVETAQKRQKDFYVDLDARLRAIETAAAQAKAAAAAAAEAKAEAEAKKTDPANETRDYEAALALLKGAQYKEALAAFAAFIKAYQSSGLLPSAHYWVGSSHYQLKDFANAAASFAHLANAWPNDTRAPDALLAQANAQIEGGDAKTGRRTLEALIEKYPTSTAVTAAKARLKSLPLPPPPKKK